ncbi:MAG: hypothetical protein U0736_27165 [Gemmataceae bacterium]
MAQTWQLAAINRGGSDARGIRQLADTTISGSRLTVSVPMQSVTLFLCCGRP